MPHLAASKNHMFYYLLKLGFDRRNFNSQHQNDLLKPALYPRSEEARKAAFHDGNAEAMHTSTCVLCSPWNLPTPSRPALTQGRRMLGVLAKYYSIPGQVFATLIPYTDTREISKLPAYKRSWFEFTFSKTEE